MRIISPFVIVLSGTEERELSSRARRVRSQVRDASRARMILAAARGAANAQIARGEGVHVDTVRKWRSRFAADRLEGLRDLPRSGRPPVFEATVVAEVKALACQLPAETGTPLSQWSHRELAAEAADRGADEKSQLQALHRRHPGLPPGPGRTRRVEFEYRRGGTLAYLAAYDVHHARVIGRCAPTTGIVPFTELVEQVMTREPYASARRVFWVTDNGSSHNGAASVQRISDAHPNATLVHLPVHASWLNQVEIYFSIVQRKVVKPQDFADLDALEHRLLAFQDRYNATAIPFNWRFGRAALHDLHARVSKHSAAAA